MDTVPVADQKQTFGAASSIETPPAATSVADDVAQQTPAQLEDVNATTPNVAETIKPMPNVPEDVEKTAGLELKDELIGTAVETTSHKATVKGDGEVAKKEKTEKGGKAERFAAEKEGSAAALATASVPVSIQLAVPSANSEQVNRNNGQESGNLILPASAKGMAGTKEKVVSLANGKGNKKADEVKDPDENTGSEITSKLLSEGELKKPDSGRTVESVSGAAGC